MDEPPYIPTFQKIEKILEIIQEHGNKMSLFHLKDLVQFDLDCPLITTTLLNDPQIKICRKRNLIYFYPKYNVPCSSEEWEKKFKTGVPKRCLDLRGNIVAHQRMVDGQFVLVKDFVEDEQVWFYQVPRAAPVSSSLADKIVHFNEKK